jgi:hypothetical protein
MIPSQLKLMFEQKVAEIKKLQHELREMEAACKHVVSDGTCTICKQHFGWGCDVSPDLVCHYECEVCDGEVELISGTLVVAPTDLQGYSEDCIYCGEPSERK